jgi:hypothetical protein
VSKLIAVLLISLVFSQPSQCQTPDVWTDFVQAQANGTKPILPDYSYSGYHFSEMDLPNVSSYAYFDVTDFGAVANDEIYDDTSIQATIDAAVASGSPAVVFFPAGKYKVSSDNDLGKSINIHGDNIVLKGEGSGENGTEIFMDQMRVGNGHWQFKFTPSSTNTSTLTTLTSPAERGDFSVDVAATANLSVGQSVFIYHKSEEFAAAHYGMLELNEIAWTRLFGADGGLILYECHIIESIDGNTVTFKNPIQVDLPTLSEPYTIRNLRTIEGVGIEDIRFTSAWGDYPEQFVHHANDIVDYGWNAIQFKYVQNSWIRNCEFKDWTQVADIRESIGVTVDNVLISGKRGHASWVTRRNYGVLVKDCVDVANHHHGPGVGYSGVSTVYLRYTMSPDQSIDSHSGSPFVTLIDDVEGGDFHSNGGPWASYPHHGRYLTLWNFRHNTTSSSNYDFWSVYDREPATYAEPFFIGLQSSHPLSIMGEGIDALRDIMVEPRSLFEAQLDLRLNSVSSANAPELLPSVQVFPNPFSNSIKIKIQAPNEVESIQLYNSNYQLVAADYSVNAEGFSLKPAARLNNGIYIVGIVVNGRVLYFKLVKV